MAETRYTSLEDGRQARKEAFATTRKTCPEPISVRSLPVGDNVEDYEEANISVMILVVSLML